MKTKTNPKEAIDVRKTLEFQTKQAKELGMTLAQYRGEEPLRVITFPKRKKHDNIQ